MTAGQELLAQPRHLDVGREPSRTSPVAKFVRAQAVNTTRHVAALRPFESEAFGRGAASPSEGHLQAANQLIIELRKRLLDGAGRVNRAAAASATNPTRRHLHTLLARKERASRLVKLIERIWDFYLELFTQRQSSFADLLLATDRIALDCYQVVYTGLGAVQSIPAPPPFSYMETGFTPSTFRRGVPLKRLGRRANPFPVIQLPYHRLVSPWTLGAILHEVSHNLQSDLELWEEVPNRIVSRLRQAGMQTLIWRTWGPWHKEVWADLCGLLLGGPAYGASLFDVVARTPAMTKHFKPGAVHPTSYLRVFISLELLRRMGFQAEAAAFRQMWMKLYPKPTDSNIPTPLLKTFPMATRLVVDAMCFQPYRQLGDKSLAHVVQFKPQYQHMIQEAAHRMAAGTDPGIIPARFLVGAARWALDHKLASPDQITRSFYRALRKR